MADNKEKAIYILECLIELIENDKIRTDAINSLTAAEIIALAEAEAAKAVKASGDLITD